MPSRGAIHNDTINAPPKNNFKHSTAPLAGEEAFARTDDTRHFLSFFVGGNLLRPPVRKGGAVTEGITRIKPTNLHGSRVNILCSAEWFVMACDSSWDKYRVDNRLIKR
ncbi:hypothetical protein GWI33_003127 [Rhynchophorus ferrugineus]|uniref:Uncharacterized protein n=1 Tax=Rhynchophorus ferrugineus TaxID=354439 RepID=A0A834M186_RHYFE|nr:hypothetical protein GWI33_003127 [Rhynchophorus ferrugineus]